MGSRHGNGLQGEGRGPGAEGAAPSLWGVAKSLVANLEEIVCAFLLLVMVFAVGISVLYRYVLSAPLRWPEELARFTLVWMTCFGAAVATKHKAHITVDFVVSLLPERARRWMAVLVTGSLIVFLVLYVVLSVQLEQKMALAVSAALSLNMALVYLSLPLGGVLMIGHLLRHLLAQLRRSASAPGV